MEKIVFIVEILGMKRQYYRNICFTLEILKLKDEMFVVNID